MAPMFLTSSKYMFAGNISEFKNCKLSQLMPCILLKTSEDLTNTAWINPWCFWPQSYIEKRFSQIIGSLKVGNTRQVQKAIYKDCNASKMNTKYIFNKSCLESNEYASYIWNTSVEILGILYIKISIFFYKILYNRHVINLGKDFFEWFFILVFILNYY